MCCSVTKSRKPVNSRIIRCSYLVPALSTCLHSIFYFLYLLTPCAQGENMYARTCVHLCPCKGLQRSKRIFWGSFTESCLSFRFHIWYPSQAMSNTCLTLVGWRTLTHSARAHTGSTRTTVLVSRGSRERWWSLMCVCVLVPAHACGVIAEREQRVEKAHIKPSTVYVRSQALFGFKKNNKQMYTWRRKILTGVQGLQCCTLP